MIQKHSTSKFATKLKFIIKKSQQKLLCFRHLKQNARNPQLNAFKIKKISKHRHKQTELEI